MDKNKNNIPDKIEGYVLLVISILLVLCGVVGSIYGFATESFAKFIILVGMGGILGDEVIKKILLRY